MLKTDAVYSSETMIMAIQMVTLYIHIYKEGVAGSNFDLEPVIMIEILVFLSTSKQMLR
jgi:hypothetical protein